MLELTILCQSTRTRQANYRGPRRVVLSRRGPAVWRSSAVRAQSDVDGLRRRRLRPHTAPAGQRVRIELIPAAPMDDWPLPYRAECQTIWLRWARLEPRSLLDRVLRVYAPSELATPPAILGKYEDRNESRCNSPRDSSCSRVCDTAPYSTAPRLEPLDLRNITSAPPKTNTHAEFEILADVGEYADRGDADLSEQQSAARESAQVLHPLFRPDEPGRGVPTHPSVAMPMDRRSKLPFSS